jgi:hypothetical protein
MGIEKCSNGAVGCGRVFELTASTNGWTLAALHEFMSGSDGAHRRGKLSFDHAGNLYGTTEFGGVGYCCTAGYEVGCGIVFELSPSARAWTENVIYSFAGHTAGDGSYPTRGVTVDGKGNIYGTTMLRGADIWGTIFKLQSDNGRWRETWRYSFTDNGDGANSNTDLIAWHGAAYGTTQVSVFAVSP